MMRVCACVCLVAGLFFVVDSDTLYADECWGANGGSNWGGRRGVHRFTNSRIRGRCGGGWEYGGGRFVSSRWGNATGCGCGYVERYGCAGNWATLRRYLTPAGTALRYVYVRNYFMRRNLHLFPRHYYAALEPADGQEITYDHFLHPDYDVAAHPLTENQHLRLGKWKFFLADYDGARESFDHVIAATPDEKNALFGRLFCSLGKRDWKTAAADMAALARIGEVRIDDAIAEDICGDEGTLARIRADLRETTRWSFGDGEAHLVSAWLHSTEGNTRLAKIHLAKAERYLADNKAAVALREAYDAAESKDAEPEPQIDKGAPRPEPTEGTPPAPAPGRSDAFVADKKKSGKEILVAKR